MILNWIKCQGDVWCKLATVNLAHDHFQGMEGVYIIWHGGQAAKVVYVGQGTIRDRLREHRSDNRIQQYAGFDLFATWASVPPQNRSGVERHLADKWQPLVGTNHPDANPIEVNSPW